MKHITRITPAFAITGVLAPEDFVQAVRHGFRAVISNRPDDEAPDQLSARAEAVQAWRVGLAFRHVPATSADVLTDAVVDGMEDALRGLDGPILAHCKTGRRSVITWAAACARAQPVDYVRATLDRAGFALDAIRDELAAQADRRRWTGRIAPALDCREGARLQPAA